MYESLNTHFFHRWITCRSTDKTCTPWTWPRNSFHADWSLLRNTSTPQQAFQLRIHRLNYLGQFLAWITSHTFRHYERESSEKSSTQILGKENDSPIVRGHGEEDQVITQWGDPKLPWSTERVLGTSSTKACEAFYCKPGGSCVTNHWAGAQLWGKLGVHRNKSIKMLLQQSLGQSSSKTTTLIIFTVRNANF